MGLLFGAFPVLFVLVSFAAGRAVNISNTWVLPEEGFPVFYRYFRDRISWFEADAVCQFHHSYLVTADSSSQYDAIRAYLKELDIADNVWIGLSKNVDKPFTWSNKLQPLTGEGHWQEPIPQSGNPLCVAMDPAKDFLWKSFACGGPEVASFICETPIPSWATGPRGCLLTELPSLTVLYIPEQSSLELTSDCGLDGTKRIACKGDADREDILKQLTCGISSEDFDDKSAKSTVPATTSSSTKTAIWTSNTIDTEYGTPTRHRRETEDTLSASSTESTRKVSSTFETFTATNYDTEVTSGPSADSNTSNDNVTYELEIVRDVASTTTTEIGTTTTDAPETSTYNASLAEREAAAEYPSAISQGQLFSIIENGTMFDIIELNETALPKEDEDGVKNKPSTKLSNKTAKKTSKKDVYKNADPKKRKPTDKTQPNPAKIDGDIDEKERQIEMEDLNKEVEVFPIVGDKSPHLNRTFRKEPPKVIERDVEDNKLELLDGGDGENATRRIDPNIEALNENLARNNDSEPVGEKPAVQKEVAEKTKVGAEGLNEEEQRPKPNRQRQLTRPHGRPFYPNFFSRVLG
ncbi:unnamed protein product [Phyllotreta striolata]|uniref:C-type lectin domain-containing protein n=1 Tax=Phyllotreta striolata TaxID=444603 RepID=A0A9N9U0T8_PHYSR|nr:unnamed protein product [Phyllotreta striolata]